MLYHYDLLSSPASLWSIAVTGATSKQREERMWIRKIRADHCRKTSSREFIPCQLQPLFGAVCQRCHKALSEPRTNTSSRPSALRPDEILPLIMPPIEPQPDQPLLGAVCHMCHRALSVPRTKISSRPSALRPAAMLLVIFPPIEAQPDQPLVGAVCH